MCHGCCLASGAPACWRYLHTWPAGSCLGWSCWRPPLPARVPPGCRWGPELAAVPPERTWRLPNRKRAWPRLSRWLSGQGRTMWWRGRGRRSLWLGRLDRSGADLRGSTCDRGRMKISLSSRSNKHKKEETGSSKVTWQWEQNWNQPAPVWDDQEAQTSSEEEIDGKAIWAKCHCSLMFSYTERSICPSHGEADCLLT